MKVKDIKKKAKGAILGAALAVTLSGKAPLDEKINVRPASRKEYVAQEKKSKITYSCC